MKILLLDIEIAPMYALVWGLFKPYINMDQIMGDSYVLTWAAKWLDSDEVIYSSLSMTSRKNMIKEIHKLMDEADVIVTYNGDNFDLKILNQEFMELDLAPPAPYKSVDLLKTMKSKFRGANNKLNYWLKKLSIGAKVEHRGFQLWIDCMNKDPDAFKEMIDYNIGDVEELEKLYKRVLPWIPNHPNHSVYEQDLVCPQCGGKHYQKRGPVKLAAGLFQRYQCTCGKWFRGNKRIEALKERFVAL